MPLPGYGRPRAGAARVPAGPFRLRGPLLHPSGARTHSRCAARARRSCTASRHGVSCQLGVGVLEILSPRVSWLSRRCRAAVPLRRTRRSRFIRAQHLLPLPQTFQVSDHPIWRFVCHPAEGFITLTEIPQYPRLAPTSAPHFRCMLPALPPPSDSAPCLPGRSRSSCAGAGTLPLGCCAVATAPLSDLDLPVHPAT